jgi:2,5-diketo-D-gluconate reductase A
VARNVVGGEHELTRVSAEVVGRAIAKSGVPRDELFVTTTLWVQDAGEQATKLEFDASLQRLGLGYLDLY